MAISKTARLSIVLCSSIIYTLAQITVGCVVSSQSLIGNALNDLTDVLSLIVEIWVLRVTTRSSTSKSYTYGLQRASLLGPLLVSIIMICACLENAFACLVGFASPQPVTRPKLLVVFGCFGLGFNFLAALLLPDDSKHDDGEDERDETEDVENGRDVHAASPPVSKLGSDHAEDDEAGGDPTLPKSTRIQSGPGVSRAFPRYKRTSSPDGIMFNSPHAIRNSIISRGADNIDGSDDSDNDHGTSALLPGGGSGYGYGTTSSVDHTAHYHAAPKRDVSHGSERKHSSNAGVQNIIANVGVIATGLMMWLSDMEWRIYLDYAMSLMVTLMVLFWIIPVLEVSCRHLLQAVPDSIDIEEIRADILSLPGVEDVHHFHVWQLSTSKVVASLHVRVSISEDPQGSKTSMRLMQEIKSCLHAYGIHSSTIQLEE